jgi:hypothetical protein
MFRLLIAEQKINNKLTTITKTSCVPTDIHKSKVDVVDM